MDNNNINTKFLAFLDYRNKFQNKSIADDILIKMIDGDQPLSLRSTKEYKEYMNILLNNIDHMYRKSDLIGIHNEFDIEDFSVKRVLFLCKTSLILFSTKFLWNFIVIGEINVYICSEKYFNNK
mgnify:CR=1 FL=1